MKTAREVFAESFRAERPKFIRVIEAVPARNPRQAAPEIGLRGRSRMDDRQRVGRRLRPHRPRPRHLCGEAGARREDVPGDVRDERRRHREAAGEHRRPRVRRRTPNSSWTARSSGKDSRRHARASSSTASTPRTCPCSYVRPMRHLSSSTISGPSVDDRVRRRRRIGPGERRGFRDCRRRSAGSFFPTRALSSRPWPARTRRRSSTPKRGGRFWWPSSASAGSCSRFRMRSCSGPGGFSRPRWPCCSCRRSLAHRHGPARDRPRPRLRHQRESSRSRSWGRSRC